MIHNLDMEPSLVGDVIDPDECVNVMTSALDLYCDRVAADPAYRRMTKEKLEEQLESVITEAILQTNPHLRDKFNMEFDREEGTTYRVSVRILKTAAQTHLEAVSTSKLCH